MALVAAWIKLCVPSAGAELRKARRAAVALRFIATCRLIEFSEAAFARVRTAKPTGAGFVKVELTEKSTNNRLRISGEVAGCAGVPEGGWPNPGEVKAALPESREPQCG